jgi:hypothetical protein
MDARAVSPTLRFFIIVRRGPTAQIVDLTEHKRGAEPC